MHENPRQNINKQGPRDTTLTILRRLVVVRRIHGPLFKPELGGRSSRARQGQKAEGRLGSKASLRAIILIWPLIQNQSRNQPRNLQVPTDQSAPRDARGGFRIHSTLQAPLRSQRREHE